MERIKTWGKDIWERKIIIQKPETVIGGSLATKKELIQITKNKMLFLEKEVFPLIKKQGEIVDVGIGPLARFSIEFARRGYNVVGIDISPTTIKLAKKYIKKAGVDKKIKLFVGDMTKINLKEKGDLIFCYATFYHIPSYLTLEVLKNFNKILKKGGYVFIEFCLKEQDYTLKNHLFGLLWFLGHKLKKLQKRDFNVTVTRFTKEEIEDLIHVAGFNIVENWKGEYLLQKLND